MERMERLIRCAATLEAVDGMLEDMQPVSEDDMTANSVIDAVRTQIQNAADMVNTLLMTDRENVADQGADAVGNLMTEMQENVLRMYMAARKNLEKERKAKGERYWIGYWTGFSGGLRQYGIEKLGIADEYLRADRKTSR